MRIQSTMNWRICLFTALITFPTLLVAQKNSANQTVLRGNIINEANNDPLSFVNVGILGTSLGTASDQEGNFILSTPDVKSESYEIFFSAIGYESLQIKLNALRFDSINTIRLTPTQYKLNEVDVNAKSRMLYGIIKDANSKIAKNYPQMPFIYGFDFKSTIETAESLKTIKGKGEIYDSLGYHRTSFADAFNARTYRFMESEEIEKNNYAFYKGITLMDELLNFDVVRSNGNVLDVVYIDKYNLNLLATTTYGNQSVYVIAYKNLDPKVTSTGDYYATSYEGEIYISKDSKAILKNITTVKSSMISPYGRSFVITDPTLALGTDCEYNFTTTYQQSNGQYVLSTISMAISYKDANKKVVKHSAELIIENFKKGTLNTVPNRDLLKSGAQ